MPVTMYRPMPEARLDGFLSGASLIEDDFSKGADLWVGDTAEWNLDAAGVRPAGLALFKPSMGVGDYEFEFLARIESKAVTCVLRAFDTTNYHKATIRRSATGEHELRRSVVITLCLTLLALGAGNAPASIVSGSLSSRAPNRRWLPSVG